MQRDALVAYLDEYLGTHAIQDHGENGLQIEGVAEISRLAFAVDANQATIDDGVASGAQMLIVHHGLFWGKPLMIVGPHRRRVQTLLAAGCSLYAVHLPLDRHPEVGNNAQLARLLNLTVTGGFGEVLGSTIGVLAAAPPGLTRSQLAATVQAVLEQPPLVLPGGPDLVQRVGIISGGAAGDIGEAARAGCDT
ncbi:MAG: Nif3-like dinuclear metal center hexameric protein, partial [Chloroflexi bacterium HGW-Chloroflexi-1]